MIIINNVLLQISNISHVNIEQEPKKKLNFISVIVLLLGLGGLVRKINVIQIMGLFFCIMSIIYFIWLYIINLDREKYLYIYMNCGNS
mgnify:CR=1 FL=1